MPPCIFVKPGNINNFLIKSFHLLKYPAPPMAEEIWGMLYWWAAYLLSRQLPQIWHWLQKTSKGGHIPVGMWPLHFPKPHQPRWRYGHWWTGASRSGLQERQSVAWCIWAARSHEHKTEGSIGPGHQGSRTEATVMKMAMVLDMLLGGVRREDDAKYLRLLQLDQHMLLKREVMWGEQYCCQQTSSN